MLDVMLLVLNIGTGVAYSGGSVKVVKFWVNYTHTPHGLRREVPWIIWKTI